MHNSHPHNVLGVDFGTSNSAVGTAVNGKPFLIDVENGETTLPTSVFFDSESKKVSFGRTANRSLIEHDEGRFMRALKSVLGTTLMHEPRYLLGSKVTFVDIIADFLRHLKQRAENELQQDFDYALSGRPVHFHSESPDRDAQALRDLTQCYMAAGFKGVEFLHEPEAAATSVGTVDRDKIALIVDLGGGTSDFCLFRSLNSGIEVLASNGVRIGGTDFDRSLSVDHVTPLLGRGQQIRKEMGGGTLTAPNAVFHDLATWEKIPSLYSSKSRDHVRNLHKLAVEPLPFARLKAVLDDELGHDIAFAVERAKIEANKVGNATVDLSFIENELAVDLSQSNLNNSLQTHADQILISALKTLEMAQCPVEKVDQIIFVGGSSLMRVIEASVSPHFPDSKLHYSDAFTAIIDGLALRSEQY